MSRSTEDERAKLLSLWLIFFVTYSRFSLSWHIARPLHLFLFFLSPCYNDQTFLERSLNQFRYIFFLFLVHRQQEYEVMINAFASHTQRYSDIHLVEKKRRKKERKRKHCFFFIPNFFRRHSEPEETAFIDDRSTH